MSNELKKYRGLYTVRDDMAEMERFELSKSF